MARDVKELARKILVNEEEFQRVIPNGGRSAGRVVRPAANRPLA
jgi:hypothetical protein